MLADVISRELNSLYYRKNQSETLKLRFLIAAGNLYVLSHNKRSYSNCQSECDLKVNTAETRCQLFAPFI